MLPSSRRLHGIASGQLLLCTTPQSPAATAPASRGALGMAQSLSSLPRPPLLGAVALRSNDGGVKLLKSNPNEPPSVHTIPEGVLVILSIFVGFVDSVASTNKNNKINNTYVLTITVQMMNLQLCYRCAVV